ncbi:Ig-like domain-containing protein [Pseudoprimorskyibacter insulae]|uniref:Leukotoxin n=1 Tax=Pseudoprimorskyibacter insulae TaxID=1695997 RepID=A0A2R8AZ47_9RHOB|nr:Ig-like domain-containing protein [Pseudoprimorskyibacter insulae]SPF81313.1 Leukotoxin [Pseudoprimorskyibacter insulae]
MAVSNIHYFFQIDQLSGSFEVDRGEPAFLLDSFTFTTEATFNGLRTSVAVDAGLSLDFAADDDLAGLLDLFVRAPSDIDARIIGLAVDGGTNQIVYDLRLRDVIFTDLNDQLGSLDDLSLVFGSFNLTRFVVNSETGLISDEIAIEYDLIAQQIDSGTIAPASPSTEPAALGAGRYFLVLDGMTGSSVHQDLEGAFEVIAYDQSLGRELSDGGRVASAVTLGDLQLEIIPGSGLTEILAAAASGEILTSARLVGVSTSETVPGILLDADLGNVRISSAETDGETAHIGLEYDQISMTQVGVDQFADASTIHTFEHNYTTNTNAVTIATAEPGTQNGNAGLTDKLLLKIEGLAGGTQIDGQEGGVEIEDFTFGIAREGQDGTRTTSTLQSEGVSITLNADGISDQLLELIATAPDNLKGAIIGIERDGQKVFELDIRDLVVTELGLSDGLDQLGLNFESFGYTVETFSRLDGTPEGSVSMGFDLLQQAARLANPDDVQGVSSQPYAGTHDFYAIIEGFNGGRDLGDLEGAIQLNGLEFAFDQLFTLAISGRTREGAMNASELSFEVDGPALANYLAGLELTGQQLSSLRVVGMDQAARTTFEASFTNLGIQNVDSSGDANGESSGASLEFESVHIKTFKFDEQQGPIPATEFGFDFTTRTATDSAGNAPNTPDSDISPISVNDHYLMIEGLAGGVQDREDQIRNAFEIIDYSFSIPKQTTDRLTPEFTVTLDLHSEITPLIEAMMTGQAFESIELIGLAGEDFPRQSQSTLLGNARISNITVNESDIVLEFAFEQFESKTFGVDQFQARQLINETKFNLETNLPDASVENPSGFGEGSSLIDLTFEIFIDGLTGPSVNGGFVLPGFTFEGLNDITTRGAKTTINELGLILEDDEVSTFLMGHLLTGTQIEAVRIVGYHPFGLDEMFDLRLAGVNVSHIEDSPTSDQASLSFKKFQFATGFRDLKNGGNNPLGDPFGFDLETLLPLTDALPLPSGETVNTGPDAVDDSFTADVGTTIEGNVLLNDTDAEGDPLTVSLVTGPAEGTLVLKTDGTFIYDNAAGSDAAFTYKVTDGKGGEDTASVNFTFTVPNNPPLAVDDAFRTQVKTTVSGNVLDNDSDPDGDPLTVHLMENPKFGNLVMNRDGTFAYINTDDTATEDSFVYFAVDGKFGSSTATVTITLDPVPANTPPVAVEDSFDIDRTSVLQGNVLANDSDADKDPLTVTIKTDPLFGKLTMKTDGDFEYTPIDEKAVEDVFIYVIDDGNGGTAEGKVLINISGKFNTPPVAVDDEFSTETNAVLKGSVLENDSDADKDPLVVSVKTEPKFGKLEMGADGTFAYTPSDDTATEDTFTYTVQDGAGGFADATVLIKLTKPNTPPIAVDDDFTVNINDGLSGNVLLNDSDPDGDPLTVTLLDAPKNGSVQLEENGKFTYFVTFDLAGSDSFTYTLLDSKGGSSTATASILFVEPVEQPNVLQGTEGDDALTPVITDRAVTIEALGGNDKLFGTEHDDTLKAGDGSDTVVGGAGNDLIEGGTTDNDLRDVVFAGGGNDTVDGGAGNDELRGDAGDDSLLGGKGVDTVIGGDGNDTLTGSSFSDLLFGGNGDDFINGGFGFDRVNGGAGADKFFHIGAFTHGSDWIQDYTAAQGDILHYGAGATKTDFLVQRAFTPNAGDASVSEVFITHKGSGVLLWALVDGDAQSQLIVQSGGNQFDLLA